ncbi:MAG: hypothetical protein KA419_11705 [Acidobacteria bacterium]|nr:hypothetical protein [Acidobacteriota bacterium]
MKTSSRPPQALPSIPVRFRRCLPVVILLSTAALAEAAGWQTVTTGGNTVNAGGGEICIDAMKSGTAYIWQPRPYGFDRDYVVSFDFKLLAPDGHWLVLYDDGFVHVSTDWGPQVTHFQSGRQYNCVPPVMKLELNRWYRFRAEARPRQKSFDLFVDGRRVSGGVNIEPGAAASPNVPKGSLELGDPEPTAYNKGKGCWRNIAWTVTGGGTPPTVQPPPAADSGSLEGEWTLTWRGALNQTHTVRFTRSGNGFTGRYTDIRDASVFAGTIFAGRGGRVVSIVQSNVTGNSRDDYFAVYSGILRDGIIEGSFHDVQGNRADIRFVRKR